MARDVRLVPAGVEDKAAVQQLLEFNAYEFSKFDEADVDRHGTFGYRHLDSYWSERARHPYLIEVDGTLAGLVLVRCGPPHTIAEFLVLPKYRRSGVGTAAARTAFSLFPGEWEVHEVVGNEAAAEFWRRAIPVRFTEATDADGTTQGFTITTPALRT